MFSTRSNPAIAAGLVSAVVFWGANNVGIKHLVGHWPPVWIGCSRMFCVSLLLLTLMRWTRWLGVPVPLNPELRRALWWRASLTLGVYVVAFTLALRFTSASHVALYLGSSPVWALLLEGRPPANLEFARKYGAAALAMGGLLVLFWPKLLHHGADWRGDALAIAASFLWTIYGGQCRALGVALPPAELTGHTMWRAGVWLAPFALWEVVTQGLVWNWTLVGIQAYCIVFSGAFSFILYHHALRHWPTSQVFLFGNLIPAVTMGWAWLLLGEAVTRTFWIAMALVIAGVMLGQWRASTGRPERTPAPNE